MVLLRKLELVNFTQHADTELELGAGLTVLAGPMGSGKTNIMGAALGSLTNDWQSFPADKASLINRSAVAKAQAYVASTWELGDGTQLRVLRGFRGCSSSLAIDDKVQKDIRGDKQITARVVELTGIKPAQLMSHHLVMQSQTSAILEAGKTDRIRFMAQILGCERLLELQAEASKEMTWVRGAMSHDVRLQLREAIRVHRSNHNELLGDQRRLKELVANTPSQEQLEGYRRLFDLKQQRLTLINDRNKISGELSRQRETLSRLRSQRDAHESDVENLRSQIKEQSQQLAEAHRYQEYLQCLASQTKATQSLEEYRRKLLEKPVSPGEVSDADRRQAETARLNLADIERHLRLMRSGKSVCDTCGQKLPMGSDTLGNEIALKERQRQRYMKTIRETSERVDRFEAYQRSASEYERGQPGWLAGAEREQQLLVELHKVIASQFNPPPPSLPGTQKFSERLQGLKSHLAELQSQLEGVEKSKTPKVEAAAKAEAVMEALEHKYQEVNDRLQGLPPLNDASLREAEMHLTMSEDLAHDRRELETAIIGKQAALKHSKRRVQELLREAKQGQRTWQWAACMEAVCEQSRPVNLPRQVLGGLLSKISPPISALCSQIGLNFRIETGDDLQLIAVHADGSREPAACLSGGQKACVAIAFWIARLVRCGDGLDALFMDEPAANLDADAVAQLGMLLRPLGQRLARARKQVILSTHHQQLREAGQYSKVLLKEF